MGFVLLVGSCSSKTNSSAPRYTLPAEPTLEAHALRGPEGESYIVGSTNLPDGMKMLVHVGAPKVIASDNRVHVHNSKFETITLWEIVPNSYFNSKLAKLPDGPKLKFRQRPLRAGNYKVQFEAYFNSGWQKPEVLTMLGGEGGKSLKGKMFKVLNSDVIDSSKKLDYSMMIEFPPLTPEARAISIE